MSDPRVYIVWLGKRGYLQPVAAFTDHDAARAFVAATQGIPFDKVSKSLKNKARTYRIRQLPLETVVPGWIVGSTDPFLAFGHYLDYCSSFANAVRARDLYPGGYIRRETLQEARDRVRYEEEQCQLM